MPALILDFLSYPWENRDMELAWTIEADGEKIAAEGTFRFAKQEWRRLRREDPSRSWIVRDSVGRQVLPALSAAQKIGARKNRPSHRRNAKP